MHLTKEDQLIARALKCLESRLCYGSTPLNCSKDSKAYLRLKLAEEKNEVFGVLFLNNSHHLLTFEKLFTGTINEAVVYPRVVVQKALEYNAAAAIVAHNHPSGNSKPSKSDIDMTRTLKNALDLINVKLLDHIIVTHHQSYSLAEDNLI